MLVTRMQEYIKVIFLSLNITGGLCSWLACSLIKLEVSGLITTLEHNSCQEDSLTAQNGWIRSYTISCSLGACFLGFALFTLSPVYIYMLEPQRL